MNHHALVSQDVQGTGCGTHDPEKLTIGVWFEACVVGGELEPGDDAIDAGWFPLTQLPDLAFPTDAALFQRLSRRVSGG